MLEWPQSDQNRESGLISLWSGPPPSRTGGELLKDHFHRENEINSKIKLAKYIFHFDLTEYVMGLEIERLSILVISSNHAANPVLGK